MMKSLLVFLHHSVSLLFWFSLFLFLTVGHGKQFNSKEAEPSKNIELSDVHAFAYLTHTRGNTLPYLSNYQFQTLIWLFRKLEWPV